MLRRILAACAALILLVSLLPVTAAAQSAAGPAAYSKLKTALVRQKIKDALNRSAVRNPVDLPEGGAALATITPKAYASGTAGLTQEFDQTIRPQLFSWEGGVATYVSATGSWRAPSVTVRSGGNVSATSNALAQRFTWWTDAQSMDVFTFFTNYRVLVDGQYVSKTQATNGLTAGGFNRLNIAPGDSTKKVRRYDIEMTSANIGGNGSALKTIAVGANDTILPADKSTQLTLCVVGDSFTGNTGASQANNGYAVQLGYLLGGVDVDVREIAIGGTGYANDGTIGVSGNPPQQYTFRQHINDLAQASCDLVLNAGGINDNAVVGTTMTAADYQAEVLATLKAERALQPNAVILTLGPWTGNIGYNANSTVIENAISAAVAQFADPNTAFIATVNDPAGAWITSINGPSMVAGSGDNTHPGDQGHLYLAKRLNTAIRAALRRLFDTAPFAAIDLPVSIPPAANDNSRANVRGAA